MCNPAKTSAGVFGGQLTALKLSIAFSDAGRLPQRSALRLGDLVMTNGACAGLTAREILNRGERALSGVSLSGACSTIAELNNAADLINNNFDNCTTNLGALELP